MEMGREMGIGGDEEWEGDGDRMVMGGWKWRLGVRWGSRGDEDGEGDGDGDGDGEGNGN
jgi:hypothetical protein